MKRLIYIFALVLALPHAVIAQNQEIPLDTALIVPPDSVALSETLEVGKDGTINGWRPIPLRAVWLGAIVPGLGQIYNQSYWKLPIVYGGIMGCVYAISWNSTMYTEYKQAYIDIVNDEVLSDDPTRSYNAILPKGYTIEMMGGRSSYTSTLNSKQALYRRYRDISIVATLAVYVLSLIDAYVDAQLFDFDVSPDLTMNVEPTIYNDPLYYRSTEVKLAIHF